MGLHPVPLAEMLSSTRFSGLCHCSSLGLEGDFSHWGGKLPGDGEYLGCLDPASHSLVLGVMAAPWGGPGRLGFLQGVLMPIQV